MLAGTKGLLVLVSVFCYDDFEGGLAREVAGDRSSFLHLHVDTGGDDLTT